VPAEERRSALQPEAARPAVPAGLHRAVLEAQRRVHLSAAAARRARVPQPVAAVGVMAAQRPAEPVVAQRLAAPAVQAAVAAAVP
jgi:hypothetical protein